MSNDLHSAILEILSAAVTILGGMFAFLWNGLTRVREETRVDIDHVKDAIEDKAGEHRQGQQQLWSEFRLAEMRANEYRARVEGRLGELPTRDDVKEARDELRSDLKAMEDRIQRMIKADVHRT